jgi:hypothetical protein
MSAGVIRDSDRHLPSSYYTDGSRLLRIVSEETHSEFRIVEDCRSLEVVLVSTDELASLGLRPVATQPPSSRAPQAR